MEPMEPMEVCTRVSGCFVRNTACQAVVRSAASPREGPPLRLHVRLHAFTSRLPEPTKHTPRRRPTGCLLGAFSYPVRGRNIENAETNLSCSMF